MTRLAKLLPTVALAVALTACGSAGPKRPSDESSPLDFAYDTSAPDGLSFAGTYKVVFLAFPFEAYGTAADKTDLMTRVKAFFGP